MREGLDEIGEVSVQTDWGETEPIGIETPTDEPIEAVSINATLINHGVGHLADAMQISRQSSAGRPMKPPSSRVAKNKEVKRAARPKSLFGFDVAA